jgi:hypothetical protein
VNEEIVAIVAVETKIGDEYEQKREQKPNEANLDRCNSVDVANTQHNTRRIAYQT